LAGQCSRAGHAVERSVLITTTEQIQPSDLGLEAERASAVKIEEMSLEEVEYLLIKKALARHAGNISHAAEALGLSRSALYRRMQKYGL
jgi:DNA-binding NtrC family response regulator